MEVIYAGIPLTGTHATEHTRRVEIPWDILLQATPLIRRRSPHMRALGNRVSAIACVCTRRYLDYDAATAAWGTFIETLPGEGQLELTQRGGGAELFVAIPYVTLTAMPTPVLHGRAVEFTFTFSASLIVATTFPAHLSVLRAENGSALLTEDYRPLLT